MELFAYLEQGIHSHKNGTVLCVTLRKSSPNQDHGYIDTERKRMELYSEGLAKHTNASRYPDEKDTFSFPFQGSLWQSCPGKTKHDEWGDQPVQHEGDANMHPDSFGGEYNR